MELNAYFFFYSLITIVLWILIINLPIFIYNKKWMYVYNPSKLYNVCSNFYQILNSYDLLCVKKKVWGKDTSSISIYWRMRRLHVKIMNINVHFI